MNKKKKKTGPWAKIGKEKGTGGESLMRRKGGSSKGGTQRTEGRERV